jgi:hypothetical protein
MTVHAALKRLVVEYCLKAKVAAVDLLADLRYRVYYKTYTKGRGLKRKHQTHKTFKRDERVSVMCDLYGQGTAEAVRTRLLFALSVQCVARGDELRDLNWSQLYSTWSAAIGEQHQVPQFYLLCRLPFLRVAPLLPCRSMSNVW